MKSIITTLALIISCSTWASQELTSVTLTDTNQVIHKAQIKEIVLDHNQLLDQIELNSGEIYYNSEISTITYSKKPSNSTPVIKFAGGPKVGGGDGSGGGFRPTL